MRGTASRVQPNVVAQAALLIGESSFRFGTMTRRGDQNVMIETRDRNTTLHAGENTIQVDNFGPGHTVVLLKTDSPDGMRRYGRWMESGAGDTGGTIIGGLPSVLINGRAYLHVRLDHGTYFLFCPQLHPGATQRGFKLGEYAQFVVR